MICFERFERFMYNNIDYKTETANIFTERSFLEYSGK